MKLTNGSDQNQSFNGVNGSKLYYQVWMPETPPKAAVVIIHGVGEHIHRHKNLIQALLRSGFAAAGFDLRGHGRSEGQRGHILSWDEYRGDVSLFLDLIRGKLPGVPLFLYGHSLGSLIILDFISRQSDGLHGALISGTSLDPTDAAPPHLVLIARILSRVMPTFSLKVTLPGNSLSRDPQVARAYDEDPLVFWARSVRWGTESLKTIQWIMEHPQQIQIPVLFLHGELDPLVSVKGTRRFFEQISSQDKTLKVYPGGLHEPHNDLQREQVMQDILGWLQSHLDHPG
jgi:alpha-beta hydrolase superfamily lysophospholipase